MQSSYSHLETRLNQLERFVKVTKILLVVCVIVGASLFVLARHLGAGTSETRVLRVRGLIIEDEAGRPRMLLGAPVSTDGRKRKDALTGLVLLGEDGIDRMTIGTTPNAQVNGSLTNRVAGGVGVLVNDPKGNERGGFGFLDDGRVSVGLDRADGNEGAILTVNDHDGWAGLRVKDHGSCIVLSLGNGTDEGSRVLFRDSDCKDRMVFGLKDSARPRLEVNDRDEKLMFDALAK